MGGTKAAPPSTHEVHGTQHLSIMAVKYVQQQLAVMTLAYDGACRLHSVAEGATRFIWRSPTGSNYSAMDVCTGPEGQVRLFALVCWLINTAIDRTLWRHPGAASTCTVDPPVFTRPCLAVFQSRTSLSQLLAPTLSCVVLRMQVVLLGDDRGALHLYSLTSEKMLASKQLSSSRITALISCEAAAGTANSNSSAGTAGASSSGSSQGGTCVQFAALSEDGVGLWQLRQGFGHGIVPGGHRQAVLVLQYCQGGAHAQVGRGGCRQDCCPCKVNAVRGWHCFVHLVLHC